MFFSSLLTEGEVSLLLDIAYLDFASEETEGEIAHALSSLKDVMVYLCMSFSKTFSFYGLRIETLSLFAPNKEQAELTFKKAKQGASALWNTANRMAMNVIADLLSHADTKEEMKKEASINRDVALKRPSLFLKEAKDCGLKVFPYRFGFFCFLPCEDAIALSNKLKDKGIYVASVSSKVIRVALCCIPTQEV